MPGGVALAGVAGGGTVSGKSGSGCGRTRRLAGRGSHPEPTGPDTVEHADSASVKALAIRQKSDLRTGVSQLGFEGGHGACVCTSGLVVEAALLPRVGIAGLVLGFALVGGVGLPPPLLHLPGAPGRAASAHQQSEQVSPHGQPALKAPVLLNRPTSTPMTGWICGHRPL